MKLKVAVFFGGESCEHEISCISANQVLHALDIEKYEVTPIYIAKNMDLYTGEELWDLANYADLNVLCSKLKKVSLVKDNNTVYIKPVKTSLFEKNFPSIDVAFLVMHGTNGEDGTLQGYMEMLKLPYTSSGILGSAIGQDKAIMKIVLQSGNIPMTPWFYFLYADFEEKSEEYIKKANDIGYPLIIKPANLGSSIGIEIAHNEEEFIAKVKEASKYDFKLVVEKMVEDLKEVNISVLGNVYDAKLSAIEEVKKTDEILDFENKYLGNAKGSKTKMPTKGSKGMASTSRIVPAPLSDKQNEEVRKYALDSFRLLNASGCVRIDFLIDNKDGKVYVNEINSIPGSLAFYLWQEVGMDFSKECDELIKYALKRYHEKEKKTYSFETNILSNFRR